MINIIPPQYRLFAAGLAALALAVAAFGAGWTAQGWRGDKAVADVRADHNEQVRKAMKAERDNLADVLATERALRADLEESVHAYEKTAAAAADRVAGLAGQHQRLREQLARRPAACGFPPGAAAPTAGAGSAGPAPELVPGDWRDLMLDEAATALRALAPAVDDARARNAVCAAAYTAARERLKRYAEQGRVVSEAQ